MGTRPAIQVVPNQTDTTHRKHHGWSRIRVTRRSQTKLTHSDIPRGTLGRALRELVELNILTIDVQPEKRGTGRNYRYTVNTTHVRELLSVLSTELLGSPS